MGWRDFMDSPHMEFMEKMESMTEGEGLIPLIPLIPPKLIPEIPENGHAKTPSDGKDLSNYCSHNDCWCSERQQDNDCQFKCANNQCDTSTELLTDFEQDGDPASCPYWFQVCWAVDMYRKQCTRNDDCKVYKFLQRQKTKRS